MSTKDDGGPAFPNDNEGDGTMSGGMSLRDYFAAHALLLFASTVGGQSLFDESRATGLNAINTSAKLAYEIADAMLAERAK